MNVTHSIGKAGRDAALPGAEAARFDDAVSRARQQPGAPAEPAPAAGKGGLSLADIGHTVLDVAGMVPVVGEAADLANAAWYLAEGNKVDAALSAAGAVPFIGNAATAGKWGRRVLKAADAAGDLAQGARQAERLGDTATAARRMGGDTAGTGGDAGRVARAGDAPAATRGTTTETGQVGRAPRTPKSAKPKPDKPHGEVVPATASSAPPAPKQTLRFTSEREFNRIADKPIGERPANTAFHYGSYTWQTDDMGRFVQAQGEVVREAGGRRGLQSQIGREGLTDDIGFHIVGDAFNAPVNRINVVQGNKQVNGGAGAYGRFEAQIRKLKDEGQDVELRVRGEYQPANLTERPDTFHAAYRVKGEDGKWGLWTEREITNIRSAPRDGAVGP